MRYEIQKHWSKLKKVSKLTDKQLEESQFSLFNKLTFINEELIPKKIWIESETLLNNIDIDDIDFVALTKHLKGKLWTGDKVLYNGLKEKGFKNVISSDEVMTILKKHRSRKQKSGR